MEDSKQQAGVCARLHLSGGHIMKNLSLVFSLVFMAMLLVFSMQSEGADAGLVGHWTFDEGSGNAVGDSSGMNNHGVIVGDVGWVDGKFGSALMFTQAQSCVRIEHSESLNMVKEVTIALWTKPEASQPDWGKLLCKQKIVEYPYSLQCDDVDTIFGTVFAAERFDTEPHLPIFTEWGHLACVYNGEAIVLYKDGEEVARTDAKDKLQQNNLPVTIGSRLASDQSFMGIIDDVKLYNRALSQLEIQSIVTGKNMMAVDSSGKLAITWGAIKEQ